MGGPRGRRIAADMRQECLLLIKEATNNGCRLKSACKDLGVDFKTINRWRVSIEDARHGPLTAPGNKLTDAERDAIIKVSTSSAFRDLSPWQIVARLADNGNYIASESSFYKVLKEKKLLEHRGRTQKPVHNKPEAMVARSANQVWSWDITYLKGPVRGSFYYLYMFMDIFLEK